MGKIVAVEYLTLDGVFEEPAWTQPYFDEVVGAFQGETLTEPTWNATFLSGDVAEAVAELKTRDENLLIYGSGQLTETLRAAGLLDGYRLLICPIVKGTGRALFTGGFPSTFTVTDCSTAPSGMILLTLTAA